MTNRLLVAALGLSLASCGRVADLEPAAGRSLPQKPALASSPLTADELLALSPQAKPKRVDELTVRSGGREPDRFDLPPPDGAAVPSLDEANEPPAASTTGPDNEDEPRR